MTWYLRLHCIWSPFEHLSCGGKIFWTLLCSKNLFLTHWLSEVKHLIQQASSLQHSESCTLYTLLIAGLTLRKMLGPAAGVLEALLSWGSSLGPEVTLKGFLFLSSKEQQSALLLTLWERKKALPFHFKDLLSSLSLLLPLWFFFPLVNEYHLSYVFTQKTIEGGL